jgi:hypothetical protein
MKRPYSAFRKVFLSRSLTWTLVLSIFVGVTFTLAILVNCEAEELSYKTATDISVVAREEVFDQIDALYEIGLDRDQRGQALVLIISHDLELLKLKPSEIRDTAKLLNIEATLRKNLDSINSGLAHKLLHPHDKHYIDRILDPIKAVDPDLAARLRSAYRDIFIRSGRHRINPSDAASSDTLAKMKKATLKSASAESLNTGLEEWLSAMTAVAETSPLESIKFAINEVKRTQVRVQKDGKVIDRTLNTIIDRFSN